MEILSTYIEYINSKCRREVLDGNIYLEAINK